MTPLGPSPVPVLVAVRGPAEPGLVAGLGRRGSGVQVVRRCADLAELLAAAGAGAARAAVLSADLPRLDREAVHRLGTSGVVVVGLADAAGPAGPVGPAGPADPAGAARLRAMGVRHVLPHTASAAAVAQAVTLALDERAAELASSGVGRTGADGHGPQEAAARQEARAGRLVAVWGPIGAPGRTTVAVTLATEAAALLARRPAGCALLVDADTYGPSVAQHLALLDDTGGIGPAVRAAQQGVLDTDHLERLAPVVVPGLRVLTGLPRPQRWPELRPSGLEVLWRRARAAADLTVVDVGFGLEADEELSFDTAAPQRNGATLSALAAADVVLAVGSGDPVGLQRLVRGLQDLAELLPDGRLPVVVVTRVREAAVGPRPADRVAAALARYAGVDDPVLVPDDRDACDAALLAGRTLTEAATRSPARQALAALAADLLPPAALRVAGDPRPGAAAIAARA